MKDSIKYSIKDILDTFYKIEEFDLEKAKEKINNTNNRPEVEIESTSYSFKLSNIESKKASVHIITGNEEIQEIKYPHSIYKKIADTICMNYDKFPINHSNGYFLISTIKDNKNYQTLDDVLKGTQNLLEAQKGMKAVINYEVEGKAKLAITLANI